MAAPSFFGPLLLKLLAQAPRLIEDVGGALQGLPTTEAEKVVEGIAHLTAGLIDHIADGGSLPDAAAERMSGSIERVTSSGPVPVYGGSDTVAGDVVGGGYVIPVPDSSNARDVPPVQTAPAVPPVQTAPAVPPVQTAPQLPPTTADGMPAATRRA